MGDMGEIFRAWNESKKAAKEKRLKNAQDYFPQNEWTIHTEHHWSRDQSGSQLDYWPSTGKWRWKNKTYNGNPGSLSGFIAKRS